MLCIRSLTLEQVAAFVALADQGNIRRAARVLYLTEQGARTRLTALERRLGVGLYQKGQGRRDRTRLTPEGAALLPQARDLLERAEALGRSFAGAPSTQTVHVAASTYLATYVLIGAIQRFHRRQPTIRIRLSTRSEREIESALLENPRIAMGVAAPYGPASELRYLHQFSMDWSLIAPPGHPLLRRSRVRLEHLVDAPLILFEPGSTGREHILEAFAQRSLSPRIEMEATTTSVIVRMVEAGLGVSIVPLLPDGSVTRGIRVGVRPLGGQIRPIQSGILTRKGERLSPAAEEFLRFVQRGAPG